MNTRQMEYIVKIAEAKSISRAAEELFVTQSALDQQLLKLESELGAKFFIRSRQSLSITPAGSIYVSYAKQMLALKKEAYTIIRDLAQHISGTLSIGLTPERGIEMFMSVYPQFYKKYPNVNVVPREIRVRQQFAMLKAEEIDLGFVTLSKKELSGDVLVARHILSEYFVAALPSSHPAAAELRGRGETKIQLSALADSPFALMFDTSTQWDILDTLFAQAGFKPNVILRTASNHTMIRMVENGLCCSVMPEYYAAPNPKISFFRVSPPGSWELCACHKRGRYLSVAAKEFVKLAADYWHKRQAGRHSADWLKAMEGEDAPALAGERGKI